MKTKLCAFLLVILMSLVVANIVIIHKKAVYVEPKENLLATSSIIEEMKIEEDPIVYDGLTYDELVDKINLSLHSTISNKGDLFVSYSLEVGVNPYLAVAIVLHETGCKWECSNLVKKCNNVGGQKGGPSCNGGSYKSYPSLDEGIKGYIDNLSKNYIQKGLLTPEQIGPKYAASKTWATKINKYIKEIKEK